MSVPAPRRLSWFRMLERLGFRWAFPIGTLAVPYHPVVVFLVPWVPLALVAWGALSRDVSAWALLLAAAVLGLLLSVPVLFYVLLVFRIPLLQGSLVACGMALLALDVAAGRLGWGWGLLPTAYVVGYGVQSVGGLVAIRQQRARNARVVAVDPTGGVLVEGPERFQVAHWLLEGSTVTRVCVDEATWMRVDPSSLAQLTELASQIQVGFSIDGELLKAPGVQPASVTVRTHQPSRSWLRLLCGEHLRAWEVEDGHRRQRLLSGAAEIVGPLPVFVCFHFVAVFGGKSRWVVGFPRRAAVEALGESREVLLRAFPPRREPPPYADPAKQLATLEVAVAKRRERYLNALDGLEHTPDRQLTREQMSGLHIVGGQAMAGTGVRLCDLVDRAKEIRSPELAEAAAQALSRIPGDELRALTSRIFRITGSRILSLQWAITPDLDVAPLPRDLPRFGDLGGFGLLIKVPDLYRRLGELDDPRVLELLDGLAAEAGWTWALKQARETYVTRHPS